MKKLSALFLLVTILFFGETTIRAQAPQKMSYQSLIRNSSNEVLVNTLVGIRISLLQGSTNGAAVFVETQTATTNTNGFLSLQIGFGTAVTGTFAGIDWTNGPYFIKTETDPLGGSNYTITGSQEVVSVPYAMYAKYASKSLDDDSQSAAITEMQARITALKAANPTNVTIGTQTWQNTNFDATTYRDGTPIPQVTNTTEWVGLTTGAWCYYNNNPANGPTYGKLYNWYAVAGIHDNDPNTPNKVLAPEGWHIPTYSEWRTLSYFLGGTISSNEGVGAKLKEAGTAHWASPNTGATNSTGFTGLPGGYRSNLSTSSGILLGYFSAISTKGYWWHSTESNATDAHQRYLDYGDTNFMGYPIEKTAGLSVRCVKD
jgi:uncharacterized protein (TIGR02145 family)